MNPCYPVEDASDPVRREENNQANLEGLQLLDIVVQVDGHCFEISPESYGPDYQPWDSGNPPECHPPEIVWNAEVDDLQQSIKT